MKNSRKNNSSESMEKNIDSIDENRSVKFQEKGVHFLEGSASQMKVISHKGKEIVVFGDQNEESNVWIERDFLQLNECRGNSSKRVAENDEIRAENREKDVMLDLSSKRVAENEEVQAEIREKMPKARIMDLSGKRIAENEQIQAENREKTGILDLSSRRVAENEEVQVETREKKPKARTLDLSGKRVAENEQIQAENREKTVILDLSSRKVAEIDEIQAEIREKTPKAGVLDLSGKRVVENEQIQVEIREKKQTVGTLDLSLALPSSNSSLRSLEPSNNNTRIGYFRNGSLSSCYSHPFSHNLSYSLTLSSKEESEYSWEGINWSDFSRFRPVEERDFRISSHPDGSSLALSCQMVNKEICDNDIDRISSSDSNSAFQFDLPARPIVDGQSGDSRVSGSMDGGNTLQLSEPERILGEIVSESIPLMARIMQQLPDETVESTKEYLRSLIAIPEKKDLLVSLQNRLNRRSDLTIETL